MSNLHTWHQFLETEIENWSNQKLGKLFNHRKEKNHPDLPLLAVTGNNGVVDRDTLEKRDTSNADKSKYLRVCEGDIAYNTMRMWQGVSGKSPKEGIVSPAYTILSPKSGISTEYAQYLFKLKLLIQVFHQNSQGLVDDTLNLKYENFSPIKVKIPPLPEQQKIASILTSVDEVIEKTQSQINKLQDLKKGTMNELLTRGIGHTEFKDSPIGKIPVGWEVVPLLLFCSEERHSFVNGPFGSDLLSSELTDSGVPVIYIRDVTDGKYKRKSTVFVTPSKANSLPACQVFMGDVIIQKVGDPPCMSAVYNCKERGIVTQDVMRIRVKNEVSSVFLSNLINSFLGRRQVRKIEISGTRKRVSLTEFKKLMLPLPPTLEQQEIASILSSMDSHIEEKERKLVQIQSLKKSLMQDLLTGKVRVSLH